MRSVPTSQPFPPVLLVGILLTTVSTILLAFILRWTFDEFQKDLGLGGVLVTVISYVLVWVFGLVGGAGLLMTLLGQGGRRHRAACAVSLAVLAVAWTVFCAQGWVRDFTDDQAFIGSWLLFAGAASNGYASIGRRAGGPEA